MRAGTTLQPIPYVKNARLPAASWSSPPPGR